MKRGYKVVVNTAAGRRRYMKYLIPQVVASEIVDRYDLWLNTTNKEDLYFFTEISKRIPKINLVWQPERIINGVKSINAFYKDCCESNTIYIKLDDDMIWLEPNFFEKMIDYRIDHPEFFLVSPLVINNGICNYILQNRGKIRFHDYFVAEPYNRFWYNGYFAKQFHIWFLENYLLKDSFEKLYCGEAMISLNRFAINAVLWFGDDFRTFQGIIDGDDEEFLTVKYPLKINKSCGFNLNALCCHFSFSAQRALLDKTNILDIYGQYLKDKANKKCLSIYNSMDYIIEYIQNNPNIVNDFNCGYKQVKSKQMKGFLYKSHMLFREFHGIFIQQKKYISNK